jgi:hypothetical protein
MEVGLLIPISLSVRWRFTSCRIELMQKYLQWVIHIAKMSAEDYYDVGVWLSTVIIFLR